MLLNNLKNEPAEEFIIKLYLKNIILNELKSPFHSDKNNILDFREKGQIY